MITQRREDRTEEKGTGKRFSLPSGQREDIMRHIYCFCQEIFPAAGSSRRRVQRREGRLRVSLLSEVLPDVEMKKTVALVLVLTLCLSVAAGCGSAKRLTLATGETTGTYYSYGSAIAMVAAETSDLKFDVVSTKGSKANIEMLKTFATLIFFLKQQ